MRKFPIQLYDFLNESIPFHIVSITTSTIFYANSVKKGARWRVTDLL